MQGVKIIVCCLSVPFTYLLKEVKASIGIKAQQSFNC